MDPGILVDDRPSLADVEIFAVDDEFGLKPDKSSQLAANPIHSGNPDGGRDAPCHAFHGDIALNQQRVAALQGRSDAFEFHGWISGDVEKLLGAQGLVATLIPAIDA